ENSIFLVAVDNNRVIGILTSEGGRYKANKHVTTLGMSIHKDYRNSGIGHKLLSFAIDWARQTNIIKRIELFVYERNISAIHLYKKLDFKKEGKRINAFFHNGRFENDYIMGLSL
ncbi:MAG: GNAT family N-acetyltransferase, partial [Fibrobacteres bacterium]|nr:GNAT family N-acetyltransferase [Fibrobacterota bacterium]